MEAVSRIVDITDRLDDYKNYGYKNIFVCQDWLYDYESFKSWSLSHGVKNGLVIDRIDSTGNYCPMNCQWVTRSVNSSRRKYDYFYKNTPSDR